MRKPGVFALIFIALFVILSGMISANTVIVGKVYNSNYDTAISGASVNVKCNSTSLDTTSKDDGLYSVIFPAGVCDNETNVIVTANKDSLTGTKTGITHNCGENAECDTGNSSTTIEFYSVINPALTTPIPSNDGNSSSGLYGLYYSCGNHVCDTGETSSTCLMDCPVKKLDKKVEEAKTISPETPAQPSKPQSNFLGITGGAISNFANSGIGIATFIAIIVVIILGITIYSIGKKRKLKK